MIIDNLNVDRAWRAFGPLEANPPLVIDADAVLSLPVSLQGLQPVAGDGGEVFQSRGRIQPVEPRFGLSRETRKFLDALAIGKTPGFSVPLAHDHRVVLKRITLTSSVIRRQAYGTERSRCCPAGRIPQTAQQEQPSTPLKDRTSNGSLRKRESAARQHPYLQVACATGGLLKSKDQACDLCSRGTALARCASPRPKEKFSPGAS
jgi:hypothetical protein